MNMTNKVVVMGALLLTASPLVLASEEDDMAEMQRQMNSETLSQPFYAEQPEKVDAYIKEAMKKGIKPPKKYTGTNWRRGYTCHDMLRYSWREYRNCRYYRSYYGRYYY